MTEWKPRFYYTWDWTSRLVQVGIWDRLTLEVGASGIRELRAGRPAPGGRRGRLRLFGRLDAPPGARLRVRLAAQPPVELEIAAADFAGTVRAWRVSPSSPGGRTAWARSRCTPSAPTCSVRTASCSTGMSARWASSTWSGGPAKARAGCRSLDLRGQRPPALPAGRQLDAHPPELRRCERRGLPQAAGRCTATWAATPARVGRRVPGERGFLPALRRAGLLVWQEFPLSSSGVENWPPEDEASIAELCQDRRAVTSTAGSITPCCCCWCGGNELQGGPGRQQDRHRQAGGLPPTR